MRKRLRCDDCDDRSDCEVYAAYTAALIANEMARHDIARMTRQESMAGPTSEVTTGYFYA